MSSDTNIKLTTLCSCQNQNGKSSGPIAPVIETNLGTLDRTKM
jgi:hypothetical protein